MLLPELKKKKTTHLFQHGLGNAATLTLKLWVGNAEQMTQKEATNHTKALPMEGTKVRKGRKLQNGNGAAGPIGASEWRRFFLGKKNSPQNTDYSLTKWVSWSCI